MRSLILVGFSLCVLFISPIAGAHSLTLNDVSILYPLPSSEDEDTLYRPTSRGAYGELIPVVVYQKIPAIAVEPAHKTYEKLRAVGIRIDPCFPKSASDSSCVPQIRMVWQPLTPRKGMPYIAVDAALHTFYDLPRDDFRKLIAEIEKLKSTQSVSTSDEPLGIHPILKKEGLRGKYAQSLAKILLSHVGEKRLSQATFMRLTGGDTAWNFGGFIVQGENIRSLPIARISHAIQAFTNNAKTSALTDFVDASIGPAPKGPDTFVELVEKRSKRPVKEMVSGILNVENPKRHNAHTVDCASCHIAQAARNWAFFQYPKLKLHELAEKERFVSRFNLTNTSAFQNRTTVLRAFGYFGTEPAISQRTIHESAAALEALYPVKSE